METAEFNKMRLQAWGDKLTKDEARIFLMVGVHRDGKWSFFADDIQTKEKVAQKLEELARMIRQQNQ